jgi:hypothetical protein
MATPSLAMIPSAYADSKVYSVLPNNGDGDFTFNRDSSATRVGQNGLIQTVGYFGSELVTNGDFATDSDWNKNAGWTISGGTANCDGTANNAIAQNFSLPTGTLRIKFDITARTQGGVNLWINKPAFTQLLSVDAVGSYEVDVVTTSGANNIYFYSASNFSGSIDNVSVQQILGDQPRLNYDISNGVVQSCPALLLEPASTNLIPYSENFNSGWTQYGSPTINTSSVISPDGTLNGSNITRGSNATPLRYQSLTSTGTQYTFSLYAKKGSVDKIYLDIGDVAEVEFTLTDEWQRFEITQTPPTFTHIDISFGTSISGDNFYIFGAQLEALSYASSYIPTAGSSQTRAAETCNDAGNAATFNSTEGTIYFEGKSLIASLSYNYFLALSDGTNANRLELRQSGTALQFLWRIGGVYQSQILSSGLTITNNMKFALKYSSTEIAFFINGVEMSGTIANPTLFPANTLTELAFDDGSGANPFQGNCKDLRVYNEALTDAQLQTLTTL